MLQLAIRLQFTFPWRGVVLNLVWGEELYVPMVVPSTSTIGTHNSLPRGALVARGTLACATGDQPPCDPPPLCNLGHIRHAQVCVFVQLYAHRTQLVHSQIYDRFPCEQVHGSDCARSLIMHAVSPRGDYA